MILTLLCAVAAIGDLEVVSSQSLVAIYEQSTPSQLAHSEVVTQGELARFRDAKKREFTVISSEKKTLAVNSSARQTEEMDGYVVCRYNANGVMDRVMRREAYDFRFGQQKYPRALEIDGKLIEDAFVGSWSSTFGAKKPVVSPINIPGWAGQKPFFSVAEANYLFDRRPGDAAFSVAVFEFDRGGRVYGLKLLPGVAFNSDSNASVPVRVAVSLGSQTNNAFAAGAFDASGRYYLSSSPTLTMSHLGRYGRSGKANEVPILFDSSLVVPGGELPTGTLDRLKSLIPEEWLED